MTSPRHFALAFLLGLLCCGSAFAEVVVVVDARSGVLTLSQEEVVNIFLGRRRVLPSGVPAIPFDQAQGTGLRGEFYRKLVNKDLAEINAYWARLYFSGKVSPPQSLHSSAEMVARVLGTPGGIGYVETGQVDPRLRVVLNFPP